MFIYVAFKFLSCPRGHLLEGQTQAIEKTHQRDDEDPGSASGKSIVIGSGTQMFQKISSKISSPNQIFVQKKRDLEILRDMKT